MRKQAIQRRGLPFILFALALLNGCLVHTHIVKRATMPSVVMTATADQLVKAVNDRCKEIHSLSTVVNFQLTEGGPRKGRQRTYTSFSGYILERKPGSLRVAGNPRWSCRLLIWLPTASLLSCGFLAATKYLRAPTQSRKSHPIHWRIFDRVFLLIRCWLAAYRPMTW